MSNFVTIKDKDGVTLGSLQTDANERLGVHNLLHVQDQKGAGTAGGTFTTGAWRTRVLNTVVVNNITGASLSANQITLPAGRYFISAKCPGFAVNTHCSRVQSTAPTATTLATGSVAYASGNSTTTDTFLDAILDLATDSTIELQHVCSGTKETDGFGVGGNLGQAYNVFASIKIWRIS